MLYFKFQFSVFHENEILRLIFLCYLMEPVCDGGRATFEKRCDVFTLLYLKVLPLAYVINLM